MSVEKQSCDSTADAVKQGDISKPSAHGDIWQTDMSESISEAVSFSTEGKESGKNVGTGCPDASYSMVRRWFENLDNFERISALSFIDGPFLATLFTFASSWSETPRMEGDDGELLVHFHVFFTVFWARATRASRLLSYVRPTAYSTGPEDLEC